MQEKITKMTVIASGGCAENILAKFLKTHKLENLAERPKFAVIDTSTSNLNKLQGLLPEVSSPASADAVEGVAIPADMDQIKSAPSAIESFIIGNSGAGKNRSALKNISVALEQCKIFDTFQDINIVIFSMSGGSGSVIGPMLLKEAARRGKATIAIGVVDACSKTDCFNSINTLRTLSKFAQDEKLYFPLMMFSNINNGRFAVNTSVAHRLDEVITLFLNKDVEEIDYTDRMNFLRPDKVGGIAKPGVYAFAVSKMEKGKPEEALSGEDYITISPATSIHTALVINSTGCAPELFSNATYLGLHESLEMLGICGAPIGETIVGTLNDKAYRFNHAEEVQQENLEDQFEAIRGSESKSGIIA